MFSSETALLVCYTYTGVVGAVPALELPWIDSDHVLKQGCGSTAGRKLQGR